MTSLYLYLLPALPDDQFRYFYVFVVPFMDGLFFFFFVFVFFPQSLCHLVSVVIWAEYSMSSSGGPSIV